MLAVGQSQFGSMTQSERRMSYTSIGLATEGPKAGGAMLGCLLVLLYIDLRRIDASTVAALPAAHNAR